MIRHRHRLGVPLRLVVDPTRADRVDVAPVALGLRVDERVAVHLRGRREQEAGTLGLRQPERVMRPVCADLQRVQRQPRVVDRARRRGHVVDEVERLVDLVVARDVDHHEREVVIADVLDVVERARLEVVQADDAMAFLEQAIAQVRAEKARTTGDDGDGHE